MTNWKEKLLKNLKVGDIVAENFGGFKKSSAYVVMEITDEEIRCRLLKTPGIANKLKINNNYCSKSKNFKIDSFGSFPKVLKLNLGYRDSDILREENLNNMY